MGISRVEDTHFPKKRWLKLKDKLIDLSTPKIMGIINLTPDSFYPGSRAGKDLSFLSMVEKMLSDGADFIDIGGFSTRPGAPLVSEMEELKRIVAPIELIVKHFPHAPISIDTFRGSVAKAAIEVGAALVNDISGATFDPEMLDVLKRYQVPYILMHSGQSLETMHQTKENEHLFREMMVYFSSKINKLSESGIIDIVIDPGFGFGKTIEQNYNILENLSMFHLLERPILVGISRKSMIYKKIGTTPENALNGTTALHTLALINGASILRVHDVAEAKQIIKLLD